MIAYCRCRPPNQIRIHGKQRRRITTYATTTTTTLHAAKDGGVWSVVWCFFCLVSRRHRGVARPLCRRDLGAVAAALRLGVTRQAVLCVARTHLLGCPHEWGLMTHCSGRGPATLPLQCHGRPSDLESNKRGYSTPSPQTIRPSPPHQKNFTCARVGGVRVQERRVSEVQQQQVGGYRGRTH